MTFKGYCDSFILEMPHVSLDLPSGIHVDIDLELEHIKTIEELKSLFNRILSNEEIVTHRGNHYKLTGHGEHMAFLHEIKDYLSRYLDYKFHITLEDFFKMLEEEAVGAGPV
jgi:hypothetical protein